MVKLLEQRVNAVGDKKRMQGVLSPHGNGLREWTFSWAQPEGIVFSSLFSSSPVLEESWELLLFIVLVFCSVTSQLQLGLNRLS